MFALMFPIKVSPESDKPSVTYRHKLSWKIREQDWTLLRHQELMFEVESEIPGTYKPPLCKQGGLIHFAGTTRELHFITFWPTGVSPDNIHIEAVFSLKTNDGGTSTDYGLGKNLVFKPVYFQGAENFQIMNAVSISIEPEGFYDLTRSCKFEAELLVEFNDPAIVDPFKKPNTYLENMKSIMADEDNSDLVIISDNMKFKCHKNILSARSEVFKNMFSKDHDFLESSNNEIHMKDVPDKAVGDMVKHLYTGDIQDDPSVLTKELLQLAAMYQLDSLKAACMENLITNFGMKNCISTFIMVDQYAELDSENRDYVRDFMLCKSEQIMKSADWEELVAASPSVVEEMYEFIEKRRKGDRSLCQWCAKNY